MSKERDLFTTLDKVHTQRNRQKELNLKKQRLLDKIYNEELKNPLKQLHNYFSELAKKLNELKFSTTLSYEIKNYGVLENLQQSKYRVSLLNRATTETAYEDANGMLRYAGSQSVDFVFNCRCTISQANDYVIKVHDFRDKSEKRSEMGMEQYLKESKIRFEVCEERKIKEKIKTVFRLNPIIPIELNFVGNPEKRCIDLITTNVNLSYLPALTWDLGQKIYHIPPKGVCKILASELVRCSINKTNKLNLLMEKGILVCSKPHTQTASKKEDPAKEIAHKTENITTPTAPAKKEEKKHSHRQDVDEFRQWQEKMEKSLNQLEKKQKTLTEYSLLSSFLKFGKAKK